MNQTEADGIIYRCNRDGKILEVINVREEWKAEMRAKLGNRKCPGCGADINDMGPDAKRCVPCAKQHKNEYQRQWSKAKRERNRIEITD
jgi:predicted amidophosphoribosyltransferase